MSKGNYTALSWDSYSKSKGISASSTVKSIYTNSNMVDALNPYKVKVRESFDSDKYPNSTPIILGLDVTGSMGSLSEEIAKGAMKQTMKHLYTRKTVPDPQIMFMAIGDAYFDSAPLQVSQFEVDVKIFEQLTQIYFEGCGGGNGGESYLAAWYFAAKHTDIDSFNKRGKKGFLFTMGDEPNLGELTKEQIEKIFGDTCEKKCYTAEELYDEVSKKYHVFHLVTSDYTSASLHSYDKWKKLLGERAFEVNDISKIPEIIESTLEVMAGKDLEDVLKTWDGNTSIAVKTALNGLKAMDNSSSLVQFA